MGMHPFASPQAVVAWPCITQFPANPYSFPGVSSGVSPRGASLAIGKRPQFRLLSPFRSGPSCGITPSVSVRGDALPGAGSRPTHR